MIKCVVIDDEPIAAEIIESFILKTEQLVMLAKFNDPLKAIHYINENDIDLLFLDINMLLFNYF